MNYGAREVWTGRFALAILMGFTILPFTSIFLMALQPSGSLPQGLSWPSDPQWGNFRQAFEVANMSALLRSSFSIVISVVPIAVLIATMAGFGIGLLQIPGARWVLFTFVFGLTLPIEGIILPLYNLMRDYGLRTRSPRDRPSAHRDLHALLGVLDERSLLKLAERVERKCLASTAPETGRCSVGSTLLWLEHQ